jgi:membrane-associated phospholipid phosphatase
MQDKEGRNQFYKSFGGAAAVTLTLKYSIKAQRPDESDDHSFPSGHTAMSFQSATFLHKRYGIKSALLAYTGATFVAFSRVYANKHYTRDVIAGALIGSVSSWFFTDRFKDVTVSMQYEKSYKEIKVSYRW